MTTLSQKKELLLQRELAFANAIGAAVLEKPTVSFWMVLIPFLFLYFIYRMQQFKSGRMKFDEEFMTTRRRAMEAAFNALETNRTPDIDAVARESGLPAPLQEPYKAWVKTLAEYYMDLLSADGETFDSLVRTAYRSQMDYLMTLNRLSTVERAFYASLKPHLSAAEGASGIIATIESQSQKLRREMAEQIFS